MLLIPPFHSFVRTGQPSQVVIHTAVRRDDPVVVVDGSDPMRKVLTRSLPRDKGPLNNNNNNNNNKNSNVHNSHNNNNNNNNSKNTINPNFHNTSNSSNSSSPTKLTSRELLQQQRKTNASTAGYPGTATTDATGASVTAAGVNDSTGGHADAATTKERNYGTYDDTNDDNEDDVDSLTDNLSIKSSSAFPADNLRKGFQRDLASIEVLHTHTCTHLIHPLIHSL